MLSFIFLILARFALCSLPCEGKVLCVPDNYPTIEDAFSNIVADEGGYTIQIRAGEYPLSLMLTAGGLENDLNQIIPFSGENVVLYSNGSDYFVLQVRSCWWKISGLPGNLTIKTEQNVESKAGVSLYCGQMRDCGAVIEYVDIIANGGVNSLVISTSYTGSYCHWDGVELSNIEAYGENGGNFRYVIGQPTNMNIDSLYSPSKRLWIHDCRFYDFVEPNLNAPISIKGGYVTIERNYLSGISPDYEYGLIHLNNGNNIFIRNNVFQYVNNAKGSSMNIIVLKL